MNSGKDLVALAGRVAVALLFILSGFGKLAGFAGTAGYIASKGLPMPEALAAIAVVAELGGGLALAIGWKTRWVAVGFVVFLAVITPIFHNFWAVPEAQYMAQRINFLKNLSILGAMLLLAAFGPGRLSADRG